jgi:oligo-1,6-glucosidase
MNEKLPWWKQSTVYQIYPRSFYDSNGDGIGDLNGITQKLPYLQTLGVGVVWLSPIYQSPNDDNGYDISDYQSIMAEFGTMEDFDRLLKEAHALGLRVVLDLVANHTSDEHPWFVESRRSKDNPYRDYYIWRDAKDGKEPNNWGSCFAGPAWEWDEQTKQYYLHLFSKKQPDLNWDNPTVREEIFSMMRWWLDKGIDGFRMDVISLISKMPDLPDGAPMATGYTSFNVCANGPHVHEYLKQMRREALAPYDTLTVGECSGVTLEEAKRYANADGSELNMVFQFEHTDMDFLDLGHKWGYQKVSLPRLKEILSRWQVGLHGIAWNSLFWQNHDQPRILNRLGDPVHYRERSAKLLAICLHLMEGTPYVYQGEELGMTNYPFQSLDEFRDLDSIRAYEELVPRFWSHEEMMDALRYKSRDNARTPMQWSDEPQAGFTTGTPWIAVHPNYRTVNAKAALADPSSIFYTYQTLIRLRKEWPFLALADYRLLLPDDEALFVYERRLESERLLVVCNFSDKEQPFTLPDGYEHASILIQNTDRENVSQKDRLKPYEAFALHQIM